MGKDREPRWYKVEPRFKVGFIEIGRKTGKLLSEGDAVVITDTQDYGEHYEEVLRLQGGKLLRADYVDGVGTTDPETVSPVNISRRLRKHVVSQEPKVAEEFLKPGWYALKATIKVGPFELFPRRAKEPLKPGEYLPISESDFIGSFESRGINIDPDGTAWQISSDDSRGTNNKTEITPEIAAMDKRLSGKIVYQA